MNIFNKKLDNKIPGQAGVRQEVLLSQVAKQLSGG
jgi:hypothetical protein